MLRWRRWGQELSSPDLSPPSRNGFSAGPLPLAGCKILIVEDEYLIAEDVAATLREAGASIIGPAARLSDGMRLAGDTGQIDAAVLNIDLGGVTVFPLADELRSRGIRFIFLTGYVDGQIPDEYAAIPRCKKPTTPGCVIEELRPLLRPLAA